MVQAVLKDAAAVKQAIDHGADPDAAEDAGGLTPLLVTIDLAGPTRPDSLEIARQLLDHGASVGPEVMYEAARMSGADAILAELLRRKVSPDAGYPEAPLASAVRAGNVSAVRRLVAAGAKVDVKGAGGESLESLAEHSGPVGKRSLAIIQAAKKRAEQPAH
jgi:ankyrin repeat protein